MNLTSFLIGFSALGIGVIMIILHYRREKGETVAFSESMQFVGGVALIVGGLIKMYVSI